MTSAVQVIENNNLEIKYLPQKMNIKKNLFESNKTYKTYVLKEIFPDGKEKNFFYINKFGKSTCFYHEQLIDGKWQFVDKIPPDSYIQLVGYVKDGKVVFYNEKQYKENLDSILNQKSKK